MSDYTWVPAFQEVSNWISKYERRQPELVQILKDIGVDNGLEDELADGSKFELNEIDPFTFFATFMKYGVNKRKELFAKLLEKIGLSVAAPVDFDGVPSAQPLKVWLFPYAKERAPDMIPALWKLFHQARANTIDGELFNRILKIPHTGFAKLTECLFYIAPEKHFPVDTQTKTWIKALDGIDIPSGDWNSYQGLLNWLENHVQEPYYKISHQAWLANQRPSFSANSADEYLSERYAGTRSGTSHITAFRTDEGRELAFDPGQDPKNKKSIKLFVDTEPPASVATHPEKYEAERTRNHHISNHAPSLATGKLAWAVQVNSLTQLKALCDWYESSAKSQPEMPVTKGNSILNTITSLPLNQILFGPPGTGKTYKTTELAVRVADPRWYREAETKFSESNELRKAVKERYLTLLEEQRIMFTTFHQSFSYEDFIEGIRASADNDKLTYEVVDGIFKQMCVLADATVKSTDEEPISLNGRRIWKMSLGNTLDGEEYVYEECIENDYLLLGYGDDIDFSDSSSRDDVRARIEQTQGGEVDANDYAVTAVNAFRNVMAKGDLVIVSDGNHKFRAIAEITGDYAFLDTDERFGFKQCRKVKWLRRYEPSLPKERLFLKSLSQMTLYELKPTTVDHEKLNQLLAPESVQEHRPHVLIIDEINRGNISRIFGELITLLEPSKRSGGDDEQTVVLPYSKKSFSVPDNLYVIGTMNTADKSLAQLDLALRRRFSFVEMLPEPELLRGVVVHGVDLKDILATMNQRIEALLDGEHTIGHAYFLPLLAVDSVEDREQMLAQLFRDKILPLLREYFFDDYERIGWVLNDSSKQASDRFIQLQDSAEIPALSKLFPEHIASEILDRRYRINDKSFSSAAAYQGILG